MKLTDENQDDMDCRPINENTGIKGSERLERLVAEAKAKRAEQARAADRPADGEVGMKLTPENLDDMDCRPGPGDGSIAIPDEVRRMVDEAKAKRAERERAAAPEPPAAPE